MADILTVAEAGGLIAAGKLSPVELLQDCLARVAALDDRLHSFVTVTAEPALAAAHRAETEIRRDGLRHALHGIPYSLKDIFETEGVRTTAQSRLLADNIPSADCAVQERLVQAGGVFMGKTATWEFAHGGPSWDVLFPPAHNPWNLAHHPAGSSSGSAASIAAGLCPASLGSDTGGSIRGPAAACGIAGLKPTYGRVSRRGVLPNCFSHDHVGPLAWTVEDVAILLGCIAGWDSQDIASANQPVPDYRAALTGDVRGMVIGVPYTWIEQDVPASPVVRKAFDEALTVFTDLGAVIRAVEPPPIAAFEDTKKIMALVELYAIHASDLQARPEMFGESLRCRIIAGSLIRAVDYVEASRTRTELAQAMQCTMKTIDVMMLPTGEPAGLLEPVPPEALFTKNGYLTAFNVTGQPALALCMGYADNGLPFSLQIAGHPFDEAKVLRAGHAYERATSWRSIRPSLDA